LDTAALVASLDESITTKDVTPDDFANFIKQVGSCSGNDVTPDDREIYQAGGFTFFLWQGSSQ
jgi:hypothetical protein